MRSSLIFLFLYFISACRSTKPAAAPLSLAGLREKYTIIDIDSIKHIYVIHARKDSTLYKIVSRKDSIHCSTVKPGREYPLVLFPLTVKEFKGNKVASHFFSVDFYGVGIRPEKESGLEVYSAINLQGLCLQF